MEKAIRLIISLFILLQMNLSYAKPGDIKNGEKLSVTCQPCHSADGNSPTPIWPKIAGMSEKYLLKQLHDFKKGQSGPRFEATMLNIIKDLSEQDLKDLSAFYANKTMSQGKTKQNLLKLGEKIYRGGIIKTGVTACAACHGPNGQGNSLAKFPRLSGQNSQYTIQQLNRFKSGDRSNDINSIMRDIASQMTDSEIEAVSSYVEGLH